MKAIMGICVTAWLTFGMVWWTIVVSTGCAGTYDPSLLQDPPADVEDADGGVP